MQSILQLHYVHVENDFIKYMLLNSYYDKCLGHFIPTGSVLLTILKNDELSLKIKYESQQIVGCKHILQVLVIVLKNLL